MSEVEIDVDVRRFKPYPAYKDSGVEWLGEIPEGWEVSRLRFLLIRIPGKSEIRDFPGETIVSYIPMECIKEFGGIDSSATRSIETVINSYTYFREGDILIAKITPCFENMKGAIAKNLENGIGFGTTELHVLRPGPGIDKTFLFYISISHPFRGIGASEMYGAGGQKRVPDDFVRDFRCPLPDINEQLAIGSFLDRETAKIDALITKKERLIELLKEKRSAVISHAVTKGLNPNVEMKDSGVSWLGNIPIHWKLVRLKFIANLQTGITLGKKYPEERILQTRPYLRVANVQDGYFDLSEITYINLPHEEIPRYELRSGDVLMTEGGDFDKLGRGHVWSGQIPGCLHQNHIFAVRPYTSMLLSYYLAALMTSAHGKAYFTSTSQQTTNLATTNKTKLGNFPISLPSVDEQQRLLARLQADSTAVSDLISKITQAIERLREYRAALIFAAVTGKIDIREEVPAM